METTIQGEIKFEVGILPPSFAGATPALCFKSFMERSFGNWEGPQHRVPTTIVIPSCVDTPKRPLFFRMFQLAP